MNASMGPPSGMDRAPTDSQADYRDSFKNPWTTVPRPMNRFMDVNPVVYERQEKEKQDL